MAPLRSSGPTVLPPAQSSTLIMASLVAVAGANLLLVAVGGRMLGPEGLGRYVILITVAQVVAMAFSVGIDTSIVYFVSGDVPGRAAMVRRSSASLVAVLAGLATGVAAVPVLLGVVEGGITGSLAVVAVPLQLWSRRQEGLLRAYQKIGSLVLVRLAQSAVLVAGLVAALLVSQVNLTLLTLLWTGGWVANALIATAALPRVATSDESSEPALGRAMLWFGLRGHAGLLAQYANYRADLLLVAAFAGEAAAGIYGLVGRAVDLLWYVPAAVNTDLLPRIVGDEALESGLTAERSDRAAKIVGLITLLGAAIAAVAAPWAVVAIFGAAFEAAADWLRIILPGAVALSIGKIYGQELIARNRPGLNTVLSIAVLVATLALGVGFIPRHGAVAAAWIAGVLYAIQAVATGLLVRWVRRAG